MNFANIIVHEKTAVDILNAAMLLLSSWRVNDSSGGRTLHKVKTW